MEVLAQKVRGHNEERRIVIQRLPLASSVIAWSSELILSSRGLDQLEEIYRLSRENPESSEPSTASLVLQLIQHIRNQKHHINTLKLQLEVMTDRVHQGG